MNQYLMNQVTDWLSKPENQAKMAQTWPGKMVQSALHAAALPGEVYAGKTDPMSEDSIQRAFELAGNVTGSAFAKGVTPNAVGIGPTKLKAAVPELPIRPSPDDVRTVADASFNYWKRGGDKDIPIDKLIGGVRLTDPNEVKRVNELVAKMKGPEGYIARILADDAGNVLEGQHRLEALRQLGYKNVPATVVNDISRGFDLSAMTKAAEANGLKHPDQQSSIVKNVLEMINEAGSPQAAKAEFEFPKGYEKLYQDVLNSVDPTTKKAMTAPAQVKAAPVIQEPQGIRAYHGSPHDFEKFDLSKIGTGEGAQSYGHGLYFAENPAVARQYRDALTDPANIPLQFQGKPVDMIWNEGISERWADVVKKLKPNQVEDFQTIMGNLSQVNDLDQVKHVLASLNQTQKNMYRDLIAPALTKPEAPKGRMYEVDLRAKPEQFLDWDRPIKEQPEILNQLRQTSKKDSWLRDFLRMDLKDDPKINGDLFHDKLKYHFGGDQAAINPYLMDQGVTGIRYLDQGSRKTPDDLKIDLARATIKGDQEAIRQIQQQIKQSQQTSNYVVFDPSIINILRKYNTGGAVANAMRFANG
jgi:hypothetical protein